jgi:hypothetical protein
MPAEQMVLSREVMLVMRRAATYAIAAQSEFVQPPHILLGLLDDDTLGPSLNEVIDRERVEKAESRDRRPEQLKDPDSLQAPFPVYRSLIVRTPDGKEGKWLDQEAFEIFLAGARRVESGAFLPKHLAQAYVSESNRDTALIMILGDDPSAVTEKVYKL